MSFFSTVTAAALLIASPSHTDAERIAANGGFLIGSAHRCGVDVDRVTRASALVHELIVAASDDDKAEEAGSLRFAEFFLAAAFVNPKKDKLVASCKIVAAELGRLERRQAALASSSGEGARPPRFEPGDGE